MPNHDIPSGIQMWHGAHHWESPFEVRAPRGKHAEHGAGLYLCCHRQTAQGYAKGGGNLVHAVVDKKMRWLEDVTVTLEVLLDAARAIPRLRRRDDILRDIEQAGRRRNGTLGLNVLVNLAVNYDAMVGQPAVDISRFLVEQGADASLYERYGGDDWVVVFNPSVLKRTRIILACDAHLYPYDFPSVREQLQTLAAQVTPAVPETEPGPSTAPTPSVATARRLRPSHPSDSSSMTDSP